MIEVFGNLYILDRCELLFTEGLVALFPEMESHHDVLVGYRLFAHDEATLVAYGVQACGVAYIGVVPAIKKGDGGQLILSVANDDSLGYLF